MSSSRKWWSLSVISLLTAVTGVQMAFGQAAGGSTSGSSATLDEVVVTASKREESANKVPMSISAVSGAELATEGVTATADLSRVVPGFVAIDAGNGTPAYFLRGVGLFDTTITAKPTVGVYIDDAPLPYSILTVGQPFDIERVEVLKGPQGTLFGSNATGGAINYIAAKPTNTFTAGMDLTLANFDRTDVSGFVSGPLSDTLSARVALRHEGGGAWQESESRPGDTLGDRRFTQGRLILAWRPMDGLRADLSVEGFIDDSDSQAAQLIGAFPQSAYPLAPGLLTAPFPHNDRQADWGTPDGPLRHADHLFSTSLNVAYDLTSQITLTSLTSYVNFVQNYAEDPDGSPLTVSNTRLVGNIHSISQELRLNGDNGPLKWVFGGNFENSGGQQIDYRHINDETSAHAFDALGLPSLDIVPLYGSTQYRSGAVFGNIDYDINSQLTVHAGARYTKTDIDFAACVEQGGNLTGGDARAIIFGLPFPPDHSCITLTDDFKFTKYASTLDQSNVSWRTGLDFKPTDSTLIYANVSRGFKAGGYPYLPGSQVSEYNPVTQEEVLAYEVGFKATTLDRTLQLNGAAFYDDYKNKQALGETTVPIFGNLGALLNIPRSKIKGGELQIDWLPLEGLKLDVAGTYLSTRITESFINYTLLGTQADFNGHEFPFTPKWQVSGNGEYRWNFGSLKPFVGGTVTYKTSTNGDFVASPIFNIPGYALLDARAGLDLSANWTVSVFGRNLADRYYWTNATRFGDSLIRFAGMPRTYGLNLSYRFK